MATIEDHDRLIARIPEDRRRTILDAVVRATSGGSIVYVERSTSRKLEDAKGVVCEILGLAWVPGGAAALALVVKPTDPGMRMIAVPVSQLVRIRWVGPWKPDQAGAWRLGPWRLGEVIVGPPAAVGTRVEDDA